ncbi:hypothetical protein LTR56_013954 [Elasticomyces elasticus]|nr:hypothetical protein LTR56_013954 [Elasticomyces elasticus]KAK3659565.1 hypothetical protein LTR22_008482 [Elasticomyces elasticus]KAK4923294.1 hypothetical protein LTR49_009557 [Elasticomyces elasticus]KAK5745432.1 hypothetical protein LTS12_023112 [Elasticomyces elasticus]
MRGYHNGRGGQHGRGSFTRGRGSWRGSSASWQPATARSPSPPVGSLVQTVKQIDLISSLNLKGAAQIKDCRLLASFNLMEGKTTVIKVPGMPPMWKPLAQAKELVEDSGEYFRDENSARFPKHPMEPAIRALLIQEPNLDPSGVDIFACGSTLGSLLLFVRRVDKPFRFVIEVIGNTVFFIRRENTADERIVDCRGYGHAFPEAYTEWQQGVKGSASHQRLIQYDFAGLKCVLRSEGDGYLEDLAGLCEGDNVPVTLPEMPGLTMQHGGHRIPQQAIFDLKTRTIKRKDEDILDSELPRLYIRQIPNFVLAFHERGRFDIISVRNIQADLKAWEARSQAELNLLGELMHKLVGIVKATPGMKCEVRYRDVGLLEFRHVLDDAPSAVSREVGNLWTRQATTPAPELDDGVALAGADLSDHSDESDQEGVDLASFSDNDSGDFTACDATCGYCGRC